jgi:hypothetical protein
MDVFKPQSIPIVLKKCDQDLCLHLSDHPAKGFPIILSPFIFMDPFVGVIKKMEDMEDLEDHRLRIIS